MTVTSELLNCVPLALSNIFCIPVIIFSGMLNIPIIPLVPSVPVISTQPVYIAYDGGVEQFFRIRRVEDDLPSAIPANNSVPSVSPAKPKPCRCGNGASKQKNSASCIGTRCKCSASGNSCENCLCLNCGNPFGKREIKSNSGRTTPRKRRKHSKGHHPTDLQFVSKSTEEMPCWNWDLYEKILLLELTRDSLENGDLDLIGLSDILTKLRQGQLKDKLPHNRNVEEVRKQILGAVGVDSAFQILLKEQSVANELYLVVI